MSASEDDDKDPISRIEDEQLPEDLQPSDDNPLAQALEKDEVDPEELDMDGGKRAVEMDDPADTPADPAETPADDG